MFQSLNITLYYVKDRDANKTYIFDEYWSYISSKSFHTPCFMVSVNSTLYITGQYNIWNVNSDLDVLLQYNAISSCWFRQMYLNNSNNLLYVAALSLKKVYVFDLNHNFDHSISISPHQPQSQNTIIKCLLVQPTVQY